MALSRATWPYASNLEYWLLSDCVCVFVQSGITEYRLHLPPLYYKPPPTNPPREMFSTPNKNKTMFNNSKSKKVEVLRPEVVKPVVELNKPAELQMDITSTSLSTAPSTPATRHESTGGRCQYHRSKVCIEHPP